MNRGYALEYFDATFSNLFGEEINCLHILDQEVINVFLDIIGRFVIFIIFFFLCLVFQIGFAFSTVNSRNMIMFPHTIPTLFNSIGGCQNTN